MMKYEKENYENELLWKCQIKMNANKIEINMEKSRNKLEILVMWQNAL